MHSTCLKSALGFYQYYFVLNWLLNLYFVTFCIYSLLAIVVKILFCDKDDNVFSFFKGIL
jgi:hypothetical protein